ncbi:MAG: recombination protein RecR [Deltaproteobacteria bacterium RIFCSPLOWO2_12_FULL_40_28]|nr:MAG: recombination protein RecR [Deltaproteobacteria bacterium RIFCSPHIGHO2_02_FULL_40_28]OGQ19938.1 MAG: recombination protein RecR [Deltaproteobacteria bacterium RIFCSPHIGHO2_12_FULL_40_32]OGQ39697.1 MAG: recombination protein RecR [Deltaproteobacteria bacterium RIFCSPLOWO2_02_FULL_40_36]OGQ52953.1 MAG: recombination protein RecR [Deltaproteobacteria bacterium RIFCSPLOWO2_12_FULL_40_28]
MNPLDRLTEELAKLPSVGKKTALRLALHIIRQPEHFAKNLSQALLEAITQIRFCETCQHLSNGPLCSICLDPKRDSSMICVVEEAPDLLAIERSHSFRGCYHVLHGVLSPIDGIGPEQLKIRELLARLQGGSIHEIILATNPNVGGDATALYLSRLLKPMGLKITRIASGLPLGGNIEYTDQLTLARALESRVDF